MVMMRRGVCERQWPTKEPTESSEACGVNSSTARSADREPESVNTDRVFAIYFH